jgi:hypothetical protein
MLAVTAAAATRREAIATVDGLVSARLERNFGHAAALAASGFEHFALAAAAAAGAATATASGLAGRAAIGTTVRLVGEALHRVELLLARGKGKLAPAIHAGQHFIGVH